MPASYVPRYNVLGVGVSALTFAAARDLVIGLRGAKRRGYICCGTAHGLVEAQRDPALRAAYNRSWLTTPDGMPLVWLGRRWTATSGRRWNAATESNAPGGRVPPTIERVYGPDLMLAVCDAGRAVGLRHYFYGGHPGVAETLREKLTARFPGLEVAGTFTPSFDPFNVAEIAGLRVDVARHAPDVLWVGLGTPKQEHFMAQNAATLDAGVLIGVGAAFDFHSGRVRQAPKWIRGSGFEWLFRFATNPRRLGWRYLKTNPLFLAHLFAQKTGLKKYELTTDEHR